MPSWLFWLLGGAALASALWQIRRPSELSSARLLSAAVLLGVAIGLLLPAASGLLSRLGFIARSLEAGDGGGAVVAFSLGAAWVGLGVWLVLGPARRLGDRRYLWLVGAVLVAARIAFVSVVAMEPGDDFAKMWAVAGDLAEDFDVPGAATSPDDHGAALRRAYFERSLPVLYPLRLVFGGDPLVYRLANVAFVVASSLLLFFLARRWFGSRPARWAFVASQLAPETWCAQLLPTHDIPGSFLTVACTVMAVALWRSAREPAIRWPRTIGLALGLAVAFELLDLQRTNAAPFLLAWLLTSVGGAVVERLRGEHRRMALRVALFILPVVGFVGIEATLVQAGLLRDPGVQKERKLKKVAAYTDSWGSGSSNHWKADWVQRPLADGDWGRVARRKLLTDTALQPGQRIALTARKANLLYDLGSQTHFYLRGAEVPGLGRIGVDEERRYRQLNAVYVVAFLASVLAGMIFAWHRGGRLRLELFPMIYLAILSATLVYAFETQPRYMFQIWTLGALYAGLALRPPPDAEAGEAEEASDA